MVVWHNLPVGPLNRHPDFIIVHPASGLLVLEVKDWRLDTIVSADTTKVELLTSRIQRVRIGAAFDRVDRRRSRSLTPSCRRSSGGSPAALPHSTETDRG
ncbi:NERD domain-containing protein [Bradyrhizobium liaoningense]|uniref:nuclease-related domain-containing protein n=1 Tax=Bradyrhizobium liaoningense TaxID=43992 RepID=UPI001BA99801|nr:nuclease-related domain-containing protein [Bradyrhizobium liaoningense]MBR0741823.1 NERD domain-containing protein [Bradyrhizobium liaoningense]